jgi:hypothetical protein
MSGSGTPADPYVLTTPAGGSTFTMHLDPDKGVWHCQVGSTWLHYRATAADDLYAMLKAHGDWMELGNKDEKDEPAPGTVEAWGRSASNPAGGWYGLRKGYRGRFANHVSAILGEQGRAEFEKRGKSWWVRAR